MDSDKIKGNMHSSYYMEEESSENPHYDLYMMVPCVASIKMSWEHRAQETGFFLQLILISFLWGLKSRARCKLFQQGHLWKQGWPKANWPREGGSGGVAVPCRSSPSGQLPGGSRDNAVGILLWGSHQGAIQREPSGSGFLLLVSNMHKSWCFLKPLWDHLIAFCKWELQTAVWL